MSFPFPLEYGTGLFSRLRGSLVIVGVSLRGALRRGMIWLLGSRNPYTPAGYVGYLTRGAVFGKSIFYGIQRGPTSAGRTWLLDVTNVSVTPYTYTEDFTGEDAVLSRDNLKIAFSVHTVWRVDESRVPLFMERFSTTMSERGHEKEPDAIVKVAYGNFIREPLRTFARDEVQQRNGLEVKDALIADRRRRARANPRICRRQPVHRSPASSSATCNIPRRSPMQSRASWRRRRNCSGRTPRSRSNGRSAPSAKCRRRASPTRCRSSAAS